VNLLPKSSLARNTGWMFLGQGLSYGLRMVYFVAIARLLGVVQYGIVVGAFAMVNLVAEHSRLGTGTVLLRYVSPNHKRFASYWGNTLMVVLVMGGVLITVLHLIAPHVIDPASAAIVALTALGSCFFEQITVSATQAFQAFQDMRLAAVFNQLTSMLRSFTAIGMLLVLHHSTARQWVIAAAAASAVAALLAVTAVTVRLGWPSFSPHLVWKHGGEGVEYAFASSTTSAYNDLDKAMLSHYGMNAANGIYGMAYRIIEMGAAPLVAIQLASSPRLFALAEGGPSEPIRLGRRLLKHGLLVTALTALSLFVCAPLIPLLAGKGFSEGVSALRWLCLIPVFRSVHGITGGVLTSIGRQRYRTLTQMAVVALNFGLNLWLIPKYGWHGAAWSSLVTDGALGALNWSILQRVSKNVTGMSATETQSVEPQESGSQYASEPLVSIIIPYYNHAAFVADAVASAREQTHSNVEVIVVDDGSAVPAESLLPRTSDVRIFRTANQGVSAARNFGYRQSSGEFLIFLDSDDRLLPDAVATHLQALERNPQAGLSFGSARIIDEHGAETRPANICRPRTNYFAMLLESNPIACPGGAMIRRSAFVDAGFFDESFRNADDYHLYLRLARRFPFVQQNTCVVEYRKHGGGKSENKERMIVAVMTALDELENGNLLTPSERRRLRHGRARWLHVFRPQNTLAYRLRGLYYSFCAMSTVPLRYYFWPRR